MMENVVKLAVICVDCIGEISYYNTVSQQLLKILALNASFEVCVIAYVHFLALQVTGLALMYKKLFDSFEFSKFKI